MNDAKLRPGQKKIRDELVNHRHPSTRSFGIRAPNKRQATVTEQRDELIDHYRYAHNL
jgi:hypothetical protein